MRQFNRILGFVAVSFVLVFLGKVNKVGLYTVYFKTIADVEIRNSTAHDHGDTQFVHATVVRDAEVLAHGGGGAAGIASLGIEFAATPSSQIVVGNISTAKPFGLRCFMDVAPRAPGA